MKVQKVAHSIITIVGIVFGVLLFDHYSFFDVGLFFAHAYNITKA